MTAVRTILTLTFAIEKISKFVELHSVRFAQFKWQNIVFAQPSPLCCVEIQFQEKFRIFDSKLFKSNFDQLIKLRKIRTISQLFKERFKSRMSKAK